MTFPVVANTASQTVPAATGLTHVLTLPTYAAGDLVLLFWGCSRGTTPGTVNGPAGWNQLASVDFTGSNVNRYRIWWKIMDGSEGTTISITIGQTSNSAAVLYDITGFNGAVAPEISVVATATSNAPNSANLTPSWGAADTLWVSAFAGDSSPVLNTYPTNYGSNQLSPMLGIMVAAASRSLNAASEDPGAFALSASKLWQAFTVAVQPAPAARPGGLLLAF